MPLPLTTILSALALALACMPPAAAATGSTATVREEIQALRDTTAGQWAQMMTPAGDFQNPFPADLASGHGAFVPPLLVYSLQRAGQVAPAERAWPRAVDPVRASSFDMIGAAYAYRVLPLSGERRAQLYGYMSRYGIPVTGYSCLSVPTCYGNLRLVDALAVIAITGDGVRAADPAARLGDPVAARAAAAHVVNRWIGKVVDHGLRARIAGARMRGSLLSDPQLNTTAYHALSAFMLSEAIRLLGRQASRKARRVSRETLDTLAALVAPDGDMSYLGRGQGQTWVPALVAGAMANGAREAAARARPVRAARYLAVARRAVRRLARLHVSPQGLLLVPGARSTVAGIDHYAHTVAYNGLALFGLTVALDALDATPEIPVGRMPAEQRLTVQDSGMSGLGVVSTRRVWMAVHRKPTAVTDLRYDAGVLALKRRTRHGWVDLLAPRPLAMLAPNTAGPALMYRGRPVPPRGYQIKVRGRTITAGGGYRLGPRWLRGARFRWTATRRGVRLSMSGARRGDRFRMRAYTPAATGRARRRTLRAAGARWRFDRPVLVRRVRGYHSGPVEQLDALEARFTAPASGRFVVNIGI